MALRPLGIVKEIVESAGMGISYAYDDLVFMEHNAFLLQFAENGKSVFIHMNEEADKKAIQGDIDRLKQVAQAHEMNFEDGTTYNMSQDSDETLRIEFAS